MIKFISIAVCFLLSGCSFVYGTNINASCNDQGVIINYKSKVKLDNIYQGNGERKVISRISLKIYDKKGYLVEDGIWINSNSSNYIEHVEKSNEGLALIEYNEIFYTIKEWYSENNLDGFQNIGKIEMFWSPGFLSTFKIPVVLLIDEKNKTASCVKNK